MKTRHILKTEADTKALAEEVAGDLHGGEVIGLIGDLGAGKTTFAKYVAAALGITEPVTSPTFTIMRVYNIVSPPSRSRRGASRESAIKTFVHIDAYRLNSADDLAALGVEEFFENTGTVTVVEWADRVEQLLPPRSICLCFNQSGNQRTVLLTRRFSRPLRSATSH